MLFVIVVAAAAATFGAAFMLPVLICAISAELHVLRAESRQHDIRCILYMSVPSFSFWPICCYSLFLSFYRILALLFAFINNI